MARRAFFSYHYDRDVWRANVVRNTWVAPDREAAGFFAGSRWAEASSVGLPAITALLDRSLALTSVTVLLIGEETASQPYVRYVIDRSIDRGNGLFGVHVASIGNAIGATGSAGPNPLPGSYPVYRWDVDEGTTNLGRWIEDAAGAARPAPGGGDRYR